MSVSHRVSERFQGDNICAHTRFLAHTSLSISILAASLHGVFAFSTNQMAPVLCLKPFQKFPTSWNKIQTLSQASFLDSVCPGHR